MTNREAIERAKKADEEYAQLAYKHGNTSTEAKSALVDSEKCWRELETRRAVSRYHVSRDRAVEILSEQGVL